MMKASPLPDRLLDAMLLVIGNWEKTAENYVSSSFVRPYVGAVDVVMAMAGCQQWRIFLEVVSAGTSEPLLWCT